MSKLSGPRARVVAVRGRRLTVEWAVDNRGRTPALEFFKSLSRADRQKVIALFKRLADAGDIASREHFKCLGRSGEGLWEFKRFQIRFLGDYRSGGRFLVAHRVVKKKDALDPEEIRRAVRILAEHDDRERQEQEP
jgi:hypothetical protein